MSILRMGVTLKLSAGQGYPYVSLSGPIRPLPGSYFTIWDSQLQHYKEFMSHQTAS